MSELIKNKVVTDYERILQLKEMILRLHDGVDPKIVKEDFRKHFKKVSSAEIIAMEQELVNDGMDPIHIQKLCDIHADVFEGSIEEIHKASAAFEEEGHPVDVLKKENRALEVLLNDINNDAFLYSLEKSSESKIALLMNINLLFDLDKHYMRKENCFFPLMEAHGFNAPPQVMWGVDDEIRDDLKAFKLKVEQDDFTSLLEVFVNLRKRIEDMIFKEEMIMLPMIQDLLTEDDWLEIAQDSKEIGYCLVAPEKMWKPKRINFVEAYREDKKDKELVGSKNIHFDVGHLNKEELELILNNVPVDMTFIDKNDTVKYFNQAKDRVFARGRSVIGRQVQNCHPPKSVDKVEKMLIDFKSGESKYEAFWIQMGPKMIHISYTALYNEEDDYIGCLEVSQDIMPYRLLDGEKRI